ncbi:MAG: hypothetical protein J3K34DRAFT_427507 [Monoraphidium minutum]|nr:MAG: hypothetical protein J3K34DRAFT_427507 [Monoraphidium minutum]
MLIRGRRSHGCRGGRLRRVHAGRGSTGVVVLGGADDRRYLRLCDGAICGVEQHTYVSCGCRVAYGTAARKAAGALGAAQGGAGGRVRCRSGRRRSAGPGVRAPCDSWSVRSASRQGLGLPSIASGARCDGIDRGCKGQEQHGAEDTPEGHKGANAGVTGWDLYVAIVI